MNTARLTRYACGTLIGVLLMLPLSLTVSVRPVQAGILDTFGDPNTANLLKEMVLDPIVWQLKSRVLHAMVRSTINWINSGFEGSPAYVTDLKATLLDVADQRATALVRHLTSNLSLNLPAFQNPVVRDVLAGYYIATSRDGFRLQNPYTLDRYSDNPDEFLRGRNFNGNGGFTAWFSAALNPQNTPIGFRSLVEDAVYGGVEDATGETMQDYINGRGYLSLHKCPAPTGMTQDANGTNNYGEVDLNAKKSKLDCPVVTSGSLFEEAANRGIWIGGEQLVTADEFSEIVGALFGQLVNKVIGPDGLGGVSRPSSAGGRSFLDLATDPSQVVTSGSGGLDTAFLTIIGETRLALETYKQNWLTIQVAAQGARTALEATTCVSDASALIANQVTPLINEGTNAIGKADAALTQIGSITSTLALSQTKKAADQASAQLAASDALTEVQRSVSASDMEFALAQAKDTGTGGAASLYTQMKQLAVEAKCGK
jgi:hypothetical protein